MRRLSGENSISAPNYKQGALSMLHKEHTVLFLELPQFKRAAKVKSRVFVPCCSKIVWMKHNDYFTLIDIRKTNAILQ